MENCVLYEILRGKNMMNNSLINNSGCFRKYDGETWCSNTFGTEI